MTISAESFTSQVFNQYLQTINVANVSEKVLPGKRSMYHLLPSAFNGIKQIGVIGFGSQGHAQSQNLRDSLAEINSSINVKVGLRASSAANKTAQAAGFTQETNTLGEMYQVIAESDMVILLISDAACASLYDKIFATMKPGATLGLSHGYLLGYLNSIGKTFSDHINVVLVAPKGMGPSVRVLYQQGKEVDGAGINASFGVFQDINGHATDHALGWSLGLGSPYTFFTTLENEYKSDIYGERGILLGGVHSVIECLFRQFTHSGMSQEDAFKQSAECITGPLSQKISHHGILSVYVDMDIKEKKVFEQSYSSAYYPCKEILLEIYDDVACGNEIKSVNNAVARHNVFPMGKIDQTLTWKVGEKVRAERDGTFTLNAFTAGTYCALMIAQIDVLAEHGHCWSEIANESVIEAVDSLNPYMHKRGVAYMVDNCSTTARLGSRKWAPRFDYILTEQAFVAGNDQVDDKLMTDFKSHKIHQVLEVCGKLRPSVDISVE